MTTMTETNLQDLEQLTFEESDSIEIPPSDIVAYNDLRSCADLFRMYQEGILEIHPDFQREIVWQDKAQTLFIDSLLKQLPIPSMCFSLDYKTEKWQVIDGLQRMSSIVRFLSDDTWRLSTLKDVDSAIAGIRVADLRDSKPALRKYYDRVRNFTLPITVIRCDHSKTSHMDYLFTIFHRLNTGSAKLNNQEIRNCIYSGAFNNFLREVDRNQTWLTMNGRPSSEGDRYRGQEQILRFFAFHDDYRDYKGSLVKFLNRYMEKHRKPSEKFLEDKRDIFNRAVEIAHKSILGGQPDKWRGISVTVMEATLVGVSLNLDHLETLSPKHIRRMYKELQNSEELSETMLREGLSARQRVLDRMAKAELVFSSPGNG